MSPRPANRGSSGTALRTRVAALWHGTPLAKLVLFLLLAAGVWFLGPFLSIADRDIFAPTMNRLVVIIGMLLAWLAWLLWPHVRRFAMARRTGVGLIHGLAIVATLLVIGLLVSSFYRNTLHLAQLNWEFGRYDWGPMADSTFSDLNRADLLASVMPKLDALADMASLTATGAADLTATGFSHADRLAASARAAYRRGLEQLLRPLVMRRLEQRLAGERQEEFLYEALKVYLMMTRSERSDAATITAWLKRSWEPDMRGELARHAGRHFAALAELVPVAGVNTGLVQQARGILRQVPLSARAYANIKSTLGATVESWRLTDKVEQGGLRHFWRTSGLPLSEGLSGLYTVDGYRAFREEKQEVLHRLEDDAWVLGQSLDDVASAELAALSQQLEVQYAREYIDQWDAFIGDLNVIPIADLESLSNVVGEFAADPSPVRAVIEAIVEQTAPSRVGSGPVGVLGRSTSRLQRLVRQGERAGEGRAPQAAVLIERHFAALNDLLPADAGHPAPIDEALSVVAELHRLLAVVSYASNLDRRLFDAVLENPQAKATMAGAAQQAENLPVPLKYWLQSVSRIDFLTQTAVVSGRAVDQIRGAWRSEILPQCEQKMAGRYPFVADASTDMALEEFSALFAPGGSLDRFWQEYLEPYVDTSTPTWRWQRQLPLPLTQDSLVFFQRVARIRGALFEGGEKTPRFGLQIKPVSLSAGSSKVTLEDGHQRLRYAHGPIRAQRLDWPSGGVQASLTLEPVAQDTGPLRMDAEGPWALLRLFDRGQARRMEGGAGTRLAFEIKGLKAVFQVATGSSGDFIPSLLTGLRCPESL